MEKYKSPQVSVIVPCYNQGKYIYETLISVQKQTFSDFECIIVNDGSTDNSLEVINLFCKEDARFSFHDKNNEGVSVARNYAISCSHGQYILPLDADDIIAPEYLQTVVTFLKENPKIKLVYTNTCFFGRKKGRQNLPDYSFELLLCRNLITCTALYRRSDYDKTQGYNPNMTAGLEDWDFWLSFLGPNDLVSKIDKDLFFYRIKWQSRNVNTSSNMIQLRKQLWHNHKDLYGNYFLDPCQFIEYQMISNSLEYKIGKMLFKPLRFFFSILFRV